MKTCTKCKVEKEETKFYKASKGGLEAQCKDCTKENTAEWRKNNLEKSKASVKRCYDKNKGKYRETQKRWEQKNKKRVRRYKVSHISKKYKTNLGFRLIFNLRQRIRHVLFKNSKFAPSLELIGCGSDKLKSHLESKFQEGMTWENYGRWHIDHIRPCASFDLSKEDQQQLCFHYTNLQPLWAADNIKKSDKWEPTIHTQNSHLAVSSILSSAPDGETITPKSPSLQPTGPDVTLLSKES